MSERPAEFRISNFEFRIFIFYCSLLLILCSCAALPPARRPASSPRGSFEALDPGATFIESLHFVIHGYDAFHLRKISEISEKAYERLMHDTQLYSFKPQENYPIVIYKNQEEYLEKTNQPRWSAGVSIGRKIYGFETPEVGATLAHEITHLLFYEFMGEEGKKFRWLNEGLAMVQESYDWPQEEKSQRLNQWRKRLRERAMPFSKLVAFRPQSEENRTVNLWYVQAMSVVQFLLDVGGRQNFPIFLKTLKTAGGLEEAFWQAYPGKIRSLAELEVSWRQNLYER